MLNPARLLILVLFFASGASGLVYEIVWVRQFGLLFGSTVYSAALVTGIYMCGLGLGSFLAGRWVDRRFREEPSLPVRAYGLFEVGIAALALLILLVLPQVSGWVAEVSSYVEAENGWYRLSLSASLLRYGSALVLLLPVTLLMGGTLTLLIRHLVGGDLAGAGWHVGVLYGVNTAGAALGCLLTDTALVPAFGVRNTQLLAMGLNLFAAAGALLLARSVPPPPEAPPPPMSAPGASARVGWASLAIALSGFAAMALQILWFRHLISLFGAYRPVFSILLCVILVGIWLGSTLAGALVRRSGRPATIFVVCLAGFVLWSLGALWNVEADGLWLVEQLDRDPKAGPIPFYLFLLRGTAWAVGPPALLSGTAFPLANALVQRASAHVGARAGLLYLANTVGGVVGSLAAGFWLLPALGLQASVTAVALSAVVAGAAILVAARGVEPAAHVPRAVALAAMAGAVLLWARLPDRGLLLRSLPQEVRAGEERLVAVREGVNETLAVADREGQLLRLITNGHNMSGTGLPAQRYMRAYVHVPMLLDAGIERVMIMCFGVGNTANAALLYPQVRRLDVVDLSADVLEHSAFFERVNGLPLEDPRVRVHVNDARQHLRMTPGGHYDLITGEPPPIAYAGVASLYSAEFFRIAASRLRPGGFMTYWLPIYQVGHETARAVVAAFREAFPGAFLLVGHRQELMLVGRRDAPLAFDPERMRALLADVPGLRRELRWISLDQPFEIAAMLAATPAAIEGAIVDAPPVSDDRPVLEYGSWLLGRDRQLPADLFSVSGVRRWCPRCYEGGLSDGELRDLRGALEVIGAYYRSGPFLNVVGAGSGFRPALGPEALRASERSLYVRQIAGRASKLYQDAARQVRHGLPAEAVASLEALVEKQPERVAARLDLADLHGEMGRRDDAREQLAAAERLAPGDPAVAAAWDRYESAGETPGRSDRSGQEP